MTKRITIEGMHCARCTGRAEKALNLIQGVVAKVDMTGANIELSMDIPDAMLTEAIEKLGFSVKGIK